MGEKYLLLDCNFLCHRAKHTMGDLSYEGNATGVIYGFLKSLSGFQDLFNTSNFVFCWDSKYSKRKKIYPEYKANRDKKEYTKEEIEFDKAFREQMKRLRTIYLPMIGFRNIFVQKGYESDDVIASICEKLLLSNKIRASSAIAFDEAIIISSDKDLYQCINPWVSFYNPQTSKILTLQRFKKQYEIHPIRWGLVKSFAGCTTDNVKGIKGVGDITAIKYLLAELNPNSKVYKAIISSNGKAIFDRNQKLVSLPMEGTKIFKLKRDNLSESGWKQVTKLLGMMSIKNRMPFGRKRR